jgi:DNA-binding NarL/FixJ family response regulator
MDRALEQHARIEQPLETARTWLARGVVLRRLRRRREAAEALDQAMAIASTLGARLWVARARQERERLSGGRPGPHGLTPTQERVARLAAVGRTDREIARELGLSPKTVEHHLSRIYRRLEVRSRTELAARLATGRTSRASARGDSRN